jgi:hypothetical protein
MANTVLIVGTELAAVGIFTLVAGASDDVGSIMVLVMIGLWLIYMVSDSKVISGISAAIGNVAQQGED